MKGIRGPYIHLFNSRWSPTRMVPSIEDVGTMLGSQMKVRMNIAPAKSKTILREKTVGAK